MTKSTITRERSQQIFLGNGPEPSASEERELARMALTAMDSSESVELPLDYLQGQKDGLEWAAQLAEANHPETGDWFYDDPIELAKAIRKGPDMPPAQPVADSEPVAWTWHYREQWHVTNDKCRAEFVATDGDVAVLPLYRHAQPAPEYPETLPCPVLLEPGLRFGKGIKTSTMLAALARRAVYESDMAALSQEERAEFQARIEDFKALIAQPVPVVSAELLHTAASAIEDLLTTKDRTGACVWFDLPFRLRSAANAQPAPVVPAVSDDIGEIRVGRLPTMNQDDYPGLGDWWVQLRIGEDSDEVLARVYGATPQEANNRAEALACRAAMLSGGKS
ncbi:hypothetical protein [Klebsiella quasipneumoniae]